jgi:hypothetical protein
MVGACSLAPFLENAKRAFDLMLQIGAGTGLIFILRWFWWRINAASEITAMVVSFLVACYFEFVHTAMGLPDLVSYQKLVIGVGVTTISWLIVTFVTKPAEDKTLLRFCRLVRVGGPGWKTVLVRAEAAGERIDDIEEKWDLPRGILCMVFGCLMVYSALFATGLWMYRDYGKATAMTIVTVVSTSLLIKFIFRKGQG